MTEQVLDIVRALLCLMPAAWLTMGVLDNILHPSINRGDVARVLRLGALEEYPEVYALVSHRRIDNPVVVTWLFRLIVLAELIATILLWLATLALFAAAFGRIDSDPARALGLAAMMAFIGVWAAFLVGGQWFDYWYAPLGQATHLMATIWGIASLAVLAQ